MSEPLSPHVEAMQRALKAAELAAEQRRLAKRAGSAPAPIELEPDPEIELLLANNAGAEDAIEDHFFLGDEADLEAIIEQLNAEIPDPTDREVHGDLVVMRPQDQAKAWYELAAEAALPAPLRELKGGVDVKMLLQALLVEIGDVKRTNAILLDQLARLEEKMDRSNRLLKDRRAP